MRDGSGNKLSPEEEKKVRSIQGEPDRDATTKVSIKPDGDQKPKQDNEAQERPGNTPAAGVGE